MVGISFQDQIIPFMSPDLVIKSIFIFISRFFGYYFEKRIVSARIDKVPVVLFFNAFYSIWLYLGFILSMQISCINPQKQRDQTEGNGFYISHMDL